MAKTTYNIPSSAGDIKEIYDKIENHFSSVYDFEVLLLQEKPEKILFLCENSYLRRGGRVKVECELSKDGGNYVLLAETTGDAKRVAYKVVYIMAALALAVGIITKQLAEIIFAVSIAMIFLFDNNSFTEKEEKRITENIDKAVKRMI